MASVGKRGVLYTKLSPEKTLARLTDSMAAWPTLREQQSCGWVWFGNSNEAVVGKIHGNCFKIGIFRRSVGFRRGLSPYIFKGRVLSEAAGGARIEYCIAGLLQMLLFFVGLAIICSVTEMITSAPVNAANVYRYLQLSGILGGVWCIFAWLFTLPNKGDSEMLIHFVEHTLAADQTPMKRDR